MTYKHLNLSIPGHKENHMEGNVGPQDAQGRESEQTRIIYIQLWHQCFLSAKSNQTSFNKLHDLKKEIADIKAIL